jgi:glycosyltransferase involved in cell wall biosynthesis
MSERIRVLHIIDSFDLGGGQTVLANLLRAMDRQRYEPEVACMHGQGVFWKEFVELGIPVHSLSPHKLLPVYLARIAKLILTRRPQIVHCHLFGSNWIAKPLAALLGVPVRIAHDHCNDGLRYEQPVARWLDTWTNCLSSHICAVSGSTRDFLIEHEGIEPERVSLIYNGIDLGRFGTSVARKRGERFVVIGVGRLHPQKNFSLFLDVAAELLGRDLPVDFRIAGTGPEEEALRDKAKVLGIDAHVQFLGHVSDVVGLYQGADALLMTSRFEGTPITVLESMAMQLPIVAPRLDGISEVLQDGQDALLIEPAEPVRFADAIERLIREPKLGARLAQSAESKVRRRHSAEAMAAAIEEIYERCLA